MISSSSLFAEYFPSPTEYFSCERTLSWLSVCVRHLWFWKKTKIEESRTKQRGGRRRPLRYIREFVRYQEGDTGENVTKQWLRLIWKLQRAWLSQLAHFAKYRRTLLELNWQEKCQKEKDKFVVCLCSAHKKKCTARPRPVFSAVFVAQNTIFTNFKSLYWPLSR